jgi:hypothetical protein
VGGAQGGADLYAVLGVPPQATSDEIARAFRERAKRLHPDVNREPGAEEQCKELVGAHAVLSDPTQRAEYDRAHIAPRSTTPRAAYEYPRWESRRRRPRSIVPIIVLAGLGMIALLVTIGSIGHRWGDSVTSPNIGALGTRVRATRVIRNNQPYVHYLTNTGISVEFPDPSPGASTSAAGSTVYVRYFPTFPDLPPVADTGGHTLSASTAREIKWLMGIGAAILFGTGFAVRSILKRRRRAQWLNYR